MASASFFIFFIYALGVILAFVLAGTRGPAFRGFVPICLGAALTYAISSASSTAQYGSAFTLLLAFLFVSLPMVAYGLGLLMGSIGSHLPRGPLGLLAKTILVTVPVLAVLFLWEARQRRIDVDEALTLQRQSAFRLTNVKGVFAGVSVTLPASPQIELYHDCLIGDRSTIRECRTLFRSAVGLRHQDGLSAPAVFREIHVQPADSNVVEWCDTRPDLIPSIWCTAKIDHHIRLIDVLEPPPDNSWSEIVSQSDGLKIYCMQYWNGFHCQSRHQVAPSVYARAWMNNPDPDGVVELASQMQLLANTIWNEIAR